jgi:hypothetical protein
MRFFLATAVHAIALSALANPLLSKLDPTEQMTQLLRPLQNHYRDHYVRGLIQESLGGGVCFRRSFLDSPVCFATSRIVKPNHIVERLSVEQDGAEIIVFQLTRKGEGVKVTTDEDLRSFHWPLPTQSEYYQLAVGRSSGLLAFEVSFVKTAEGFQTFWNFANSPPSQSMQLKILRVDRPGLDLWSFEQSFDQRPRGEVRAETVIIDGTPQINYLGYLRAKDLNPDTFNGFLEDFLEIPTSVGKDVAGVLEK